MPITPPRTNDPHEMTRYYDKLLGLPPGGGETGAAPGGLNPVGGIIMWDYLDGPVPVEYVVCDGTNGTYDMRDRIPMGAVTGHAVGTTEGNRNHTHAGPSHTHGDGSLSFPETTSLDNNAASAVLCAAGGLSVSPYSHTHDVSSTNIGGDTAAGGTGNTGNPSVLPVPVIYVDFIKRKT